MKNPKYFEACRTGMYLVVNGPEGTGRRAFFGAAGLKQQVNQVQPRWYQSSRGERSNASRLKVEHRDNAFFVAYAPFKHPRILVAVIL